MPQITLLIGTAREAIKDIQLIRKGLGFSAFPVLAGCFENFVIC